MRALIDWCQRSGYAEGKIFRRISKIGTVGEGAINPHSWNRLLRQLASDAGLPNAESISSHSLRRGFATEASRLGASMPAIQRHGRWRSVRIWILWVIILKCDKVCEICAEVGGILGWD